MRVYNEDEKCVIMTNIKILNPWKFIAENAKNTMRYMTMSMMKSSAVIVVRYCV